MMIHVQLVSLAGIAGLLVTAEEAPGLQVEFSNGHVIARYNGEEIDRQPFADPRDGDGIIEVEGGDPGRISMEQVAEVMEGIIAQREYPHGADSEFSYSRGDNDTVTIYARAFCHRGDQKFAIAEVLEASGPNPGVRFLSPSGVTTVGMMQKVVDYIARRWWVSDPH